MRSRARAGWGVRLRQGPFEDGMNWAQCLRAAEDSGGLLWGAEEGGVRGQLGFRHSLSKAGAPRRGRKDGPGHAVRILHVSEFSPTRTSHSAAGPARPSRAPSGLTAHAPVTLSDV